MVSIRRNKNRETRTICEVHRILYKILEEKKEKELLVLVEEAFNMAKKMNNKLRQYKHNYDDGWWEKNRLAGGEVQDSQE